MQVWIHPCSDIILMFVLTSCCDFAVGLKLEMDDVAGVATFRFGSVPSKAHRWPLNLFHTFYIDLRKLVILVILDCGQILRCGDHIFWGYGGQVSLGEG